MVYVLERTPGAENPVAWTDICHNKNRIVYVDYRPLVFSGKWGAKEAALPFAVFARSRHSHLQLGRYKTLEAAIKAAEAAVR